MELEFENVEFAAVLLVPLLPLFAYSASMFFLQLNGVDIDLETEEVDNEGDAARFCLEDDRVAPVTDRLAEAFKSSYLAAESFTDLLAISPLLKRIQFSI